MKARERSDREVAIVPVVATGPVDFSDGGVEEWSTKWVQNWRGRGFFT